MRFLAALAMSVTALSFVAAGDASQDKFEKVISQLVTQLEKTGEILATVKDKASAGTAQAKLKEMGSKFKEIQAEGDKLGKPDDKVKGELETKYKGKIETAVKRIVSESIRLNTVEGGPELLKEMQAIFPKMGGAKKK